MKLDFQHKQSAHCENGVISNLLKHHGIELSEPMVFGLGSGLFFTYLPFIKVNFAPGFSYRPMPGSIFKNSTKLLGFKTKHHKFSSPEQAEKTLNEYLKKERPVGLQVGVFNLTYFPTDYRFHFNAHNLVVYGKQGNDYLISDPVMETPTLLSKEDLEKVRFAKGAFAPKGHLYYIEKIDSHYNLQIAIKKAIKKTCSNMLAPVPIIGVKAIEWVSKKIKKWPNEIGIKKTNHYLGQLIRMQEEIGTGGGGFRYIYAAFLSEAADHLNLPILKNRSHELSKIGDEWRDFALNISRIYKSRVDGNDLYDSISNQLYQIAQEEKAFFKQLKKDIS